MNIDNNLKGLMIAASKGSDEDMELFIQEFMDSNILILSRLNDENFEKKEYYNFEDFDNFNIVKIEDLDGNEFIPLFTDEDEINKLEVSTIKVIMSVKDLTVLLFDNQESNYGLKGIILNPFNEYSVEIPYMALFELFGFIKYD